MASSRQYQEPIRPAAAIVHPDGVEIDGEFIPEAAISHARFECDAAEVFSQNGYKFSVPSAAILTIMLHDGRVFIVPQSKLVEASVRQVSMEQFRDAFGVTMPKPPAEPTPPAKQETWRDRPSLL